MDDPQYSGVKPLLGDICLTLASRGDGTFHWTITLPHDENAGLKLHASNKQGPWRFLAEEYTYKSTPELCIIMKIGHLGSHTPESVKRMVEALPMDVLEPFAAKEPRFTCRVWVKQAIVLLNENDVLHVDVEDVEKAAWASGAEHDPKTITGAPYMFCVYAN
ncbi:uncharacterized protein SCHCODRAFT_02660710 [Schizophyllum commune H4-8]|uniref:uncharacterized protein n=1 Tax=Schizophyllum commune (strain H4-8 / FGSC 9210) TaxID=578458 RepID=UPI002160CAF6|nr:uncharacterized protein SCHCODRAFT_02660710 [Schizophyllum commune H4-8]KAI5899034.1 hypothetical protein SCHCODRAFT_02660710 [Schizophyllum commune H4-8]